MFLPSLLALLFGVHGREEISQRVALAAHRAQPVGNLADELDLMLLLLLEQLASLLKVDDDLLLLLDVLALDEIERIVCDHIELTLVQARVVSAPWITQLLISLHS